MNWTLLLNSFAVSGLATLVSVAFGLMAALWLAGLAPGWRGRWLAVAIMALALPPFLVTNCWLHYLGTAGTWHQWLPLNIYSLGGSVWILALLTWPITLLAVLGSWRRLEAAQLESDMAVTGFMLLRGLLLPLARSALLQAAVLTFVLALNNFAVPAILQVKVFPAEVWVRFNTTFDSLGALKMSWPLVVVPLLALIYFRRTEVAWPRAEGRVSAKLFRQQLGAGWWAVCGAGTVVISLLAVALPLVQLATTGLTWSELPGALAAGQLAIWNSFSISAVTATLCLAAGLASWRWPLGVVLWLPFLVPGVLLGIGLIAVFNRPFFSFFYQHAGIVILALGIRYLAFGWNGASHALRGVDRDLTDAARLEGASRWQLLRHVHWPQISPQLAAAWYIVFLLCLWDVESMVLIVPPGGETLALRVFNLLHYGHNAQVNSLCLALLALAVAPLVLWGIAKGLRIADWRRGGGGPDPYHATEYPASPSTREDRSGGADFCLLAPCCGKPSVSEGYYRELPPGLPDRKRSKNETRPLVISEASQRPQMRIISPLRISSSWGGEIRRLLQAAASRSRISFAFVVAFVAMLLAGCSVDTATEKKLDSKFFSRVEVIGHRGVGVGEFNKPRSIAIDREDNIYVVDMTARVQKFSPDGKFLLLWQMTQTDLGKPKGMGRDADGNIIVVEPHYQRINIFSPDGKLVNRWGERGTNAGQLIMPRSVAVNSHGNFLISEYSEVDRVQEFSPRGDKLVQLFGRPGLGIGEFNRAEGLDVDAQDRIYVADSCNHRIQIFSPDGKFLRSYGKPGTGVGEMSYPYDVRVDKAGRQYVCEFENSRIQIFDANGKSLEIIGGPGYEPGQFSNPYAIALDSKGNLYVADSQNHRVQKFVRRQDVAEVEPSFKSAGGLAQSRMLRDQSGLVQFSVPDTLSIKPIGVAP
jgi:ABC-type Fe3+ transport system permease subunit/DNA-binding beta-propeller fold protein YncE